jgi:hypothetical protein
VEKNPYATDTELAELAKTLDPSEMKELMKLLKKVGGDAAKQIIKATAAAKKAASAGSGEAAMDVDQEGEEEEHDDDDELAEQMAKKLHVRV